MIKVIKESADTTDLVMGLSSTVKEDWDIQKIIDDLQEGGLSLKSATDIAKNVEERVLKTGHDVSVGLIREMIDAELYERGWNKKFKRHTSLNLPVKHFEQITFTKTNDNANFQNNNPELISHTISEILGKQYSLNYLFEPDVANAHMNGELYIHDMGQPNRYYCWASSLAYILKNGLKLDSVTSRSLPAKSASVLTGHLQTYLASMQAYFAGAIGITYTNIVYAPLLRGLTDKQIKQICQEIVFSISQTAFARGGQSLPPSEPIIIRHNDKVQVVRIGELVDEQIKKFGGPTQDTSVERTGYNLEGIEVLSFTPEKVCKFLPITDFIRTKHNKKNLVGLTTNRGTCNVTDYHSVFSLDNGVIKPVKALDLNVGDSIVAANKVDFNDTIESFGGLKTDETFGEMLAHTLFSIALASTGKYYLKIMNNDEIIEDFELAYRKLFGRNSNITVRHFGQPNTKTSTLDLDEDQKTEFINAFNICLSKDLSLPEFAYYLPPKTKKAFIEKAIWISEKAYNKKNCICLKGNDNYKKDRMATGINFLLSTINKLGSTQTVGHNTYDIYVSDNNEDYLGKARISHIKEYACGGYVYDLSVGETNAFCGGTGLSFYHNTIFTDLNLHYNIPYYMQHTAAILPGGKYGVYVKENTHNTGREKPCYKGDLPTLETGENYYDPSDGLKHKIVFVDTLSEATKLYNNIKTADNVKDCHVLTYKDFEPECQKMMSFLIDVYREGDADGKPFFFPKPNVHIEDGMLEDENVRGLVEKTCELAAYNGSPYFVYDRGKDVKVSMCCLTGDTKVFAKEGGQIKVINIRDYQQGMKVLSYNTSMYKKEWVVPEKFLELENKDKILRVTLSNGSVVNMTKDHVCLYFDNSSLRIQEKTADKLCVNDFLPAIKHIYRDEIINEVSREYLAGKFVGYYLAYGQPFGKKRASWKLLSTQLYAINDISSFIAEMYPDDPEHDTLSVRKCSEARNKIFAMLIKYENSGIVNYLKKYLTYDEEGGFKLRDCVFGMGQNFISGLVEAVCNGHFHARKDNYRCFVYNKTAAIQLQTLFKMVGADVEIEKVDKENFSQKTELRVAELSGSNVLWRIKVLGQHNLRKSFCYNDKSTQREKKVDVYSPVVNSFIKKIKKAIKRNPDKKFYKRLLNAFIERGNLSCVKVVKIEEVELVEKVYDFTVNKENPTFVLANGLATHNCLSPSEEIIVSDNGKTKRIPIGQYNGEKVLTYKDGDIYFENPEKFLCFSYNDDLLEIVLENGDKMHVTKDHPSLLLRDGKLEKVRSDTLNIGDYLPYIKSYESLLPSDDNSDKYESGKFVGLYVAEGKRIRNGNEILLSFNINEIELLEFCEKFMAKFDHTYKNKKINISRKSKKGNGCDVVCYSKQLKNFLGQYVEYNKPTKDKRLKPSIFNETKYFIRGFIDGFLLGDGYERETKTSYEVSYHISSEGLARDIKNLLKLLGINSTIRESTCLNPANKCEKLKSYTVKICTADLNKLQITRNPKHNAGTSIYSKLPITMFDSSYKDKNKNNNLERHRIDQVDINNDLFTQCKSGKLHFLKIESINKIPYNGNVYDFTMQENNPTFCLANGIWTSNCRLTTSGKDISEEMIMKPDTISFIGVQNVSINSPHCGFTAAKKLNINPFGTKSYDMRALIDATIEETKRVMDLAVKAHKNRRRHIKKLLVEGAALHFTSKSAHGKPLVDVDKGTYLIGLIGINNLVQFITGGHQMHEDKKYLQIGIEIVAHMSKYCKELTEKHKMKITLEESPAETAAGSLARLDYKTFGDFIKPVLRGENEGNYYYDNSVHFTEGSVDFIKKIIDQSRFHPLVQSGNIIHVWIGEKKPSKDAIFKIVEMTQKKTQAKQIVFSPIFTFCDTCGWFSDGQVDECGKCGEKENISLVTRVVGYFSKINGWNNSKKSEFMKRNYENIDPKTNY